MKGKQWALNWLEGTVVASVVLLCAAWYTSPLCMHPGSYLVDAGDPLQHLAVTWWTSRKLLSGHVTGMWSVPPMFWPDRLPLAFGDPQFGTTLLGLPVFAFTHNALLAYNLVLMVSMPLSALGAYALVRHITRTRGPALFAALLWGYGLWHSAQASHQQILSTEGFALILLAVHRFGEMRQRRFLILLFAAWFAQEFLAEYWGAALILIVLPTTLYSAVWVYPYTLRDRSLLAGTVVAAVVPWLAAQWPLFAAHRSHPPGSLDLFSSDLSDYLPQTGTMLWRDLGHAHFMPGAAVPSAAHVVTPGLVVLVLAAVAIPLNLRPRIVARQPREGPVSPLVRGISRAGLALAVGAAIALLLLVGLGLQNLVLLGAVGAYIEVQRAMTAAACGLGMYLYPQLQTRITRRIAVDPGSGVTQIYLVMAALAILFSCGFTVQLFGITLGPGPLYFLSIFPGVGGIRVMARMGIVADLALIVLAAQSAAEIKRRAAIAEPGRRTLIHLVLVVVAGLAALENLPHTGPEFRNSAARLPAIRAVDRWLARQPYGVVAELPVTNEGYVEGERLWRQTVFRKPMLNGVETFMPRAFPYVVTKLRNPESADSLRIMHEDSVRYVVADRVNRYEGRDEPLIGPLKLPVYPLPAPYRQVYADREAVVYTIDRQP